ncbi:hypothetical protein BH23VER1_BH23VER1_15260 [soil metagenome]
MLVAVLVFLLAAAPPEAPAASPAPKIVLIAGDLDSHPPATHEYEKSVLLLKHCLDTAPALPALRTEVHFHGWPEDASTLEDADCIVMVSAGSDQNEADHPFYAGDRMAMLDQQVARGCGIVALHWSTFAPLRAKAQIFRWLGGFFDYEGGSAANGWYSAITTREWQVDPASPGHPVLNGVPATFPLEEEFYYRLRFLPGGEGVVPLWRIGTEAGESGLDNVTAWCLQREDGGRGFGCTGGHFYANWEQPDFRKTVLNGIVWSAGVEVPPSGVEAPMLDIAETRGRPEPWHRALILTGYHHPGHDWEGLTGALREVLGEIPTLAVDVTRDPEILARVDLSAYDVLIQNYNNWDRPGWSPESQAAFRGYLAGGGGLVVLHYANGAFYRTTPAGIRSHWDEYAGTIVRRYWDHQESGHDPFGRFTAAFTDLDHPIIQGLHGRAFETTDELYFKQKGDLPIEPLVTARSKVTGRDEPLAFAYPYGEGRVFQSLLGHDPGSVRAPGTAELLRRGTLWAAGADLAPADPAALQAGAPPEPAAESAGQAFVGGKFGRALNAGAGGLVVPGKAEFRTLPVSVEGWARLDSKGGFNILAACDPKRSAEHWELYTYSGTGELSLYLPGRGGEFRSGTDVCDGRWHHLAAVIAEDAVRLFVDGHEVLTRAPSPLTGDPAPGGFAIGRLVEGGVGCAGLIDDLRVSSGRRSFEAVPAASLERDEFTIRLWPLDGPEPGGHQPDAKVGTFTPRRGPAPGAHDPVALHPYNADRLADFYTQEAEHYLDLPASDQPEILPPFPGIDGGGFGHWGRRDDDDWRDSSWNAMDLGPVFAGVLHGLGQPIPKAVAVRLGEDGALSACFDPLTGGIQGAWAGGFVRFDENRFGFLGGIRPDGQTVLDAKNAAGWDAGKLEFAGTYRHCRRAVFAYSLDGTGVLDHPWAEGATLVRVLEFDAPLTGSLRLVPATGELVRVGASAVRAGTTTVSWASDGQVAPRSEGGLVRLDLQDARHLSLRIAFDGAAACAPPAATGLRHWTAGGQPLWPRPLATRGTLGAEAGAYAIDTLTVPYDNPWKAPFYLAGNGFLPDGTAAVCTIDGDVWTVSGIDAKLERLEWRRFATGLHQPLGLVVVDDRIHVLGRDQITVLHDRDGDGEADYYENFTNRYASSAGGHDYITGLERDAAGNFYFASGNQGICWFSPDGAEIEILATGVRNPNGLGVATDGTVAVSPQEGDWTPASMVCLVEAGRHFGHRGPLDGQVDPPLCFIPRGIDHATGGHVFAESDRWGPLGGQLITLSWGNCRALLTLRESVGGLEQGAVVPLEGDFLSGVHRGRMSPVDGQLYVTGSTGWGTYATRPGCFQRMRYTGKEALLPVAFHAHRNGVRVEFSEPLDPASARPENVFLQRWNYDYSRSYGSPELSVAVPDTPGHDRVGVGRVVLLGDGRSLFVEVPEMAPVDQLHLFARVRSPSGHEARRDLFATVHRLGPVFDGYPGFEARAEFAAAPPDLRRAANAGGRAPDPSPAAQASFPKRPTDPALAGRPITIRCISGLRYDVTEFSVTAGENVSLTLENTDVIPHNLVIAEPGTRAAVGERAALMLAEPGALDRQYAPDMDAVLFHTLVIDPEQSDTLHFRAPTTPGEYPFLCTFPGHWLIMNGTMRVLPAR